MDIIEAGFAMASEGDFAAIATITQAIRKPRIASLARAKTEDIEMAARALQFADRARIHVFLASSDLHLEYKLKIGRQRGAGPDAANRCAWRARWWTMSSFRPKTPPAPTAIFWWRWCALPSRPAPPPSICRTRWATRRPRSMARCSAKCASAFRPSTRRASFSPRTATTIWAWPWPTRWPPSQAGARQVECTINGIGERAGNAALEEIAAALYVRGDRYGVTTGIKLDQLYPTSQVLGQLITFRPSPNKAIVGDNAFAHESGIHQHGMLANPLCYEIMTPELVGVAKTHLVLGKHSGRAALRNRLEQLGFTLTRDELQHTYYRFVALADRKKNIYDQDLVGLLPDQIRERRREPVSELD